LLLLLFDGSTLDVLMECYLYYDTICVLRLRLAGQFEFVEAFVNVI